MVQSNSGESPSIHPSAYVAPNAMVYGDVTVGANCCIMFGAQIIAESSPVVIGDYCIVLENAVIRGTQNNPVKIGDHCLVGPNTHLVGCTIEDEVFIATGAAVFHGAQLMKGSEVRINGVVHLKTVLPPHTTVPINWIALGDPAQLFSPDQHEEIWKVQQALGFDQHVYGLPQNFEGSRMQYITKAMWERLGMGDTG